MTAEDTAGRWLCRPEAVGRIQTLGAPSVTLDVHRCKCAHI